MKREPEFLWYIPNQVDAGHRGDSVAENHNSLETLTAQALALEDHGWKGALLGAGWGRPDTFAESGSAGPAHPHGIATGTSCIAVVGPGVTMSRMVETGSSSRIYNMEAFAKAALSLFHEALAGG
jgi:hypothetical protein